jgi:hypothetical protein
VTTAPRFDQLMGLWLEGERRVADADRADRPAIDRVIGELIQDLNRRLGGQFTTDELAALYLEQGTDWCFDLATRIAPRTPAAWDVTMVAGAAFARYARRASDYGGGRRRAEDAE